MACAMRHARAGGEGYIHLGILYYVEKNHGTCVHTHVCTEKDTKIHIYQCVRQGQ